MADRIAVIIDGRIQQVGTPVEIFAYPATRGGGRFHRGGDPAGRGDNQDPRGDRFRVG